MSSVQRPFGVWIALLSITASKTVSGLEKVETGESVEIHEMPGWTRVYANPFQIKVGT
jgi:hypothetical protein